jgi:hypothetical protein
MMNTSQPQLNSLPDSDFELLSAYIDDQLGAAERAELDRRLGAEPRLRAELEGLRATAALLGDLEPLPLPRSFTLDPARAPRRRGLLSLAWAMQLSGGLAGLALVLLASLQMLTGVSGSAAMAPAMPPVVMQQYAATTAPFEAPAPMMAAAAATEAPAATQSPLAAAVAPETTQDSAARDAAPESMPSGMGAPLGAGAPALTQEPTVMIAASELSSSGTQGLEPLVTLPAAKSAPPPAGTPIGLVFGLGVVLLALSLGSFLYRRSRR